MPRSVFSKELSDKILELVAKGHTHRSVAEACGVSRSTLYHWRQLGEAEGADADRRAFAEGFVRATGEGILAIEKVVLEQACSEGEGELGLKVLGRRRWKDWGQQGYRLRQLEKDLAAIRGELRELRESREQSRKGNSSGA